MKLRNLISPDIRDMARNVARVVVISWRRYRKLFVGQLLTTSFGSAMPFVRAAASALLVNDLVRALTAHEYTFTHRQVILLAVFIAATFLPLWLSAISRYLGAQLQLLLTEYMDLEVIKQNGSLDVARHENKEFADLTNRVLENGSSRVSMFMQRLYSIVDDILGVVIACVVLGVSQWVILLVIIIATIPELLAESRYGARIWNIHGAKAEVRRRYYDLREHFYHLPNLIELQLFQNITHFFGMIRELYMDFQVQVRSAEHFKMRQRLFTKTLSQIAVSFATVWFAIEVVHGNLQVGTFTFLLSSIAQLRGSLSNFFGDLGLQFQDSLFITDLFNFLDTEPVVIRPSPSVRLDQNMTPEIVFDHVTFTYPGTNAPVFDDFSLRIPSGRKLAIVGVNGAGKTTLIKLLCRFYDPQSGRILVGGHDLRQLDLDSWYHMIGALFQDYSRYHLLVQDAIALGRTGSKSDIEKVKAVAEASEADAFIEGWEKSYEQQLGKNFTEGVEPSVGQWQKLALARTFYRDPRVLILDEPTSSIDAESEAKIFESIEALPSDRTTFMISHRFSTVRRAEQIVVIENGKLLEQGSHDELMDKDGTYARLFRLQAKGYQE